MSPDMTNMVREAIMPKEGVEQAKDFAIPLHPDGTDEGLTGTDGIRRRPIGAELNNADDPFSESRRKKTLLTKMRTLLTQGQIGAL